MILQPALLLLEVLIRPARLANRQPFSGQHFEAVGRPLQACGLLRFPVLARVNPGCDLLAGRVTPRLGVSQPRVGVSP